MAYLCPGASFPLTPTTTKTIISKSTGVSWLNPSPAVTKTFTAIASDAPGYQQLFTKSFYEYRDGTTNPILSGVRPLTGQFWPRSATAATKVVNTTTTPINGNNIIYLSTTYGGF